jgi:Uncharacterized protein, putative amidase
VRPIRLVPLLALAALIAVASAATPVSAQSPSTPQAARGIVLGDLTWPEAEKLLTPDAVIVIPLGAEAKEHGPHLRLDNDLKLAEYYRGRVLAASNVIMAPMVNYHFYPAFVEYPGLDAPAVRDGA